MTEHFIEASGVSLAWAKVLLSILESSGKERTPLTVAINGSSTEAVIAEDARLRTALDHFLAGRGKASATTVANTIFPAAFWDPELPREKLFDRYQHSLPRLMRVRSNQFGTYFGRMIANGPPGSENQLDFVLEAYLARSGVRRSVLQVAIFDPKQDHSTSALRGFPCLQHVSFAPTPQGTLSLNAFYAKQYVVSRAYGNYLGLCHLGRFVAHELGLNLARVTIQIGMAELEVPKQTLRGVQQAALALVESETQCT